MLNRLPMLSVRRIAALFILISGAGTSGYAQSLNWEGQTGGLVTPFAYTVESRTDGISLPAISFHVLSGGEVVGTHYQSSVTVGFLSRIEVGYTRSSVTAGSDEPLCSLFDRGFNVFHGKVILVPENSGNTIVPAISAGFVVRYQSDHLEGNLGSATQNGDFVVVATKTLSQIKQAPIVLSGGVKVTNAALLGFAGNAPDWAWCAFFFAGVNLGGKVLIGGEYAQQPSEVKDLDGAEVPGTFTFMARVVPDKKARLSINVALFSFGEVIGEGLDMEADNRFSFGVGYRF